MKEKTDAVNQPEKPVQGPLKSDSFSLIDDQSISQILPGEKLTVASNNGIEYTIHYQNGRIHLTRIDTTLVKCAK